MITSIKNKLLAYLTGVILFVSLTTGLSAYLLMTNYLTKTVTDELALAAHMTSDALERYLDQKKDMLERVGQGHEIEEYVFKYKALPILKYLGKFRHEFPVLSYINKDGQEELKVVNGVESDHYLNLGNKLLFQDALWSPNKAVISAAELDRDLGVPVFKLALALYNYFGDSLMGALSASLPLSRLEEITKKTKIGKTGFITLIDKKGTVLVDPDKNKLLKKIEGKGENAHRLISKLMGRESGFTRAAILGIDSFVSYVPVNGYNISVMVILPYREFVADLDLFRNTVFLIAGATIFIMGLLAIFISGRFTKPVVKLSEASLDVAMGNFSRKIDNGSRDEIGTLVTAFNQMTSHIQAYRDEIISEKEYSENIMASMSDALIILDSCGDIKKISGATCRLSGYDENELIGKDISTLIEGIEQEDLSERRSHNISTYFGKEARLLKKSGTFVPVIFSVTSILDNDKRDQGILCVAHNITERKQWEESLLSLKKAIETVQLGITISDVDRNIIYVNRAEAEMHGYGVSELFGMQTSIFAPEELRKTVDPGDIKTFKQRSKESVNIRKDGSTFPVMLRSDVILNDEGDALGIITTSEDLTERKREEKEAQLRHQQLIQADKMKSLGVLVSGVAHEINNPNNFIRLNSQTMKDIMESLLPLIEESGLEKDEYLLGYMTLDKAGKRLYELMDGIMEGSKRIEGIVGKLKDFARQDSFDYAQDVDMNAVIKVSISMMENMIKKSTDHFSFDSKEGLPLVKGNKLELEQVIINLLTNACQALPGREKGINISTFHNAGSDTVMVVVKDEGIGMDEEMIRTIEEPFVTSKRDQGGLGLGLSVSSSIIRKHGGTMEFSSLPGKGTTVIIVLPLREDKTIIKEDS